MLQKVDGSQASINGRQQTGKTFEVSWEGSPFILTSFHQHRTLYHQYQWSLSFFFFNYLIEAWLFYSIVLISAV